MARVPDPPASAKVLPMVNPTYLAMAQVMAHQDAAAKAAAQAAKEAPRGDAPGN